MGVLVVVLLSELAFAEVLTAGVEVGGEEEGAVEQPNDIVLTLIGLTLRRIS